LEEQGKTHMIVMLTGHFTELLGGGEKQCATLTKALYERGVDVLVVTSRVPGLPVTNDPPYVKRFWTYKSPYFVGRHFPAALLWGIQVLFWIAFNRRKIDVLHCHLVRFNAHVGALAHFLWGIPTIMKPGSGGERNDYAFISRRKYVFGKRGARFIATQADIVIAISEQIAKDTEEWGTPPDKIFRVPNGVNLAQARSATEEHEDLREALFQDALHFAFVGRFSEEKNVIPVINAALSLSCKKKIVLHLIGAGGDLETEARALAKNAPSNIDIRFHGRLDNVFAVLNNVHFLILASASEGLSNALLEACSLGVVPLLSEASGNRDVVYFKDYPLFIQHLDAEAIAHGMNIACRFDVATWKSWSLRILEHTHKTYDIHEVAGKYCALYQRLAPRLQTRWGEDVRTPKQ
jgi:glycosyltransferase involved in cell wall biosynthesis